MKSKSIKFSPVIGQIFLNIHYEIDRKRIAKYQINKIAISSNDYKQLARIIFARVHTSAGDQYSFYATVSVSFRCATRWILIKSRVERKKREMAERARERRDDVKRKRVAGNKSSKIEAFFLAALAHLIYLTIMGWRRYSERREKDERARDRVPY